MCSLNRMRQQLGRTLPSADWNSAGRSIWDMGMPGLHRRESTFSPKSTLCFELASLSVDGHSPWTSSCSTVQWAMAIMLCRAATAALHSTSATTLSPDAVAHQIVDCRWPVLLVVWEGGTPSLNLKVLVMAQQYPLQL